MDDFITLGIIALLCVFIIGVIYNGCLKSTKEKTSKPYTKKKRPAFPADGRSRFVKEGMEQRIRRRMKGSSLL